LPSTHLERRYASVMLPSCAPPSCRQVGRDAGPPPTFVTTSAEPLPEQPDFDVVVCGGTLGIFLACALLLKGYRRVHEIK
jgi:hypothetical protein